MYPKKLKGLSRGWTERSKFKTFKFDFSCRLSVDACCPLQVTVDISNLLASRFNPFGPSDCNIFIHWIEVGSQWRLYTSVFDVGSVAIYSDVERVFRLSYIVSYTLNTWLDRVCF